MRIAIDAMGGDHAPGKHILTDALQALELLDAGDQLILVGNQEIIQQHLTGFLPCGGWGEGVRD